MQHAAQHTLSTTSTVARLVGCSEGCIRSLSDRGIVQPQRDSLGRRLFTAADVAAIREHVASRQHRAA